MNAARAFRIWRDEGVQSLLVSIRRFIHYRVPNNRVSLQIYYLFRGILLTKSGDQWCLHDPKNEEKFYFPQLESHVFYCQNHTKFLQDTYFYSEEVQIEEGDTVIDVGAYIGQTTKIAAKKANQVYAIEPSPRALPCLKKNTDSYDNIEIIECAVSDEEGELELQFGKDTTDDSLIMPDDGNTGETKLVPVTTIKQLMKELNLKKVGFLKVEAEGVEPEVIQGAMGANIEKIACSGNDERYGENTYQEVANILVESGYSVNKDSEDIPYKMVYAKKS